VTGNYRAWRHFIAMRASEHADVEIRRLAHRMSASARRRRPPRSSPTSRSPTLADGTEVATSPARDRSLTRCPAGHCAPRASTVRLGCPERTLEARHDAQSMAADRPGGCLKGCYRPGSLNTVSSVGFDAPARLGTLLTAMVTPFAADGSLGYRCGGAIGAAPCRCRMRWPGALGYHRRVADHHGRRKAQAAGGGARSGGGPGAGHRRRGAPTTPRTASSWPRPARPRARTDSWW